MITAMVAGYFEASGNEVYSSGADAYTEFCYGVQDMCNQMPCTFHGPPGVRMVSNNNTGPVPVPLQIPPGHLVQHVVDENGTLRHILFSPPMALPVGAHYSPSHASTTAMATPSAAYYPYPQPPYAPPHFHPQAAPSHLQPPMNHQNMHSMIHPPQCNGQTTPQDNLLGPSPPPGQHTPTPAQKDDRYQRQTYKFRRKLESRSKDSKLVILPQQSAMITSKKERKRLKERHEDGLRMNGGSSGSNASEDEEITWIFTEYLSNMRPPVVTELSQRSVMVCWKPPEAPASDSDKKFCSSIQTSDITYEVMLCEKGKEGHYRIVYSGKEHHCSITSLKPSTEYFVCVQAFLEELRGSTVKSVTFKTPSFEPETPQPPWLYSKTKNSLTLKWNGNNETNSKIKGYILEYDEGCGEGCFVQIYSGPLKQYKVSKLSPSTCYQFRLASVNEKGKSPYSDIFYCSTSGNAPSQPLPPVLKQAFINRLHLEWEKRTGDDDFSLQIDDENSRHGFMTAYSGRETTFMCCGLRGNTEYKFRLCASNEEGTSPWSKVVIFSTLPDKLSSPGKPIPKGRIHASCFRVMWDPPRESKPSSITKYILEVDRGYGFDAVYTGPETEFFLENLLPGTMYKLRVACISSAGHSPYSEMNSITTAAVVPGKCAPPKLQSKPEASFLCLEWAHPEYDGGSAVAEYEVDMTSPDNVTLQAYKGTETSCIVSGLLPGRPYLFQVRAYNRVGSGPWSDPLEVVSGAGPPDAPRNLTVCCSSPHSCTALWEEPVNNGATITSYCLQWSTEDEDESFTELYVGPHQTYDVQGMSPATQYYFRVRAINDAGPGAFSEVTLCQTPASVPGAISTVNVNAASDSLYLSWTEPLSNGSEILSYNIELEDYLYSTEENVPELCIEELTAETAYRVRVQAVNAVGEGPFSEPLKVVTLKSPPNPPQMECIAASHNSLKLRWGEGRNTDFTYYTLEMANKTKSFVPVYHGTGLSHKINRLQENTSYQFRICASSESGQGPYSEIYIFQTTRAPPPSLKGPKVSNVTENACLIEWTGVKPLAGQSFSYQVQLITNWGMESKTVYQGSDTKVMLDSLEPQTHYGVRVAAVRHCDSENLIGAFSPSTALMTLSMDTSSNTSLVIPHVASPSDKRTFHDRHWAAAIVTGLTLLSFLFAVIIEHSLSLSTLS